uniref:Sushi domain-containing protein n=1 Tax=Seriola dumerili TaxID=41447 RepID=A0A3B4UT25_SERDU
MCVYVCVEREDAVILYTDHGILSLSVFTAAEIHPSVATNQQRASLHVHRFYTRMTCLSLSLFCSLTLSHHTHTTHTHTHTHKDYTNSDTAKANHSITFTCCFCLLSPQVCPVSLSPTTPGSFYVESGTGVSVGSVLTFLVQREDTSWSAATKFYCTVRNGKPQWSNYLPVCEAIPRPEDRGLRVAVLASVVTGPSQEGGTDSLLHRRRRKRRVIGSLPPPKISTSPEDEPPSGSRQPPLPYWRESAEGSLPGLYRSESQLYPHVVLQRVPTPTAPSRPFRTIRSSLPPPPLLLLC